MELDVGEGVKAEDFSSGIGVHAQSLDIDPVVEERERAIRPVLPEKVEPNNISKILALEERPGLAGGAPVDLMKWPCSCENLGTLESGFNGNRLLDTPG